MTKPMVFISYSHKDEEWKNRLVSHLGVLQQEKLLDIWEDRRIVAGDDWYPEIQKAINTASVAILMVSADFLTSKFILGEEVPLLLERREKEGLRIFPVIVRPCAWQHVQWLSRMQARPKDGRAISGGSGHEIDTDMAAIADEIISIIRCAPRVQSGKGLATLGPEKISLAKLPSTGPELFGREKELKVLDEAWENPKTNILSLTAWGGVGKTALINVWLNKMCDEHYRGAERVYGWSFYSQGASEKKQVSTDLFIASALEWFGDSEPNKGTPWEKGERLADLIKKKRTLLILDGLEPLQNPPGEKQGQIKDPALKYLLRELANNNSGLCIITSRLEVDDIKDFVGKTVQKISLDHLSSEAGAQFLEHLGAKGKFDELKQASIEFDGHALALSLLGRYIAIVYQGDIRQRDKIARLTDEQKQGGHARRVIESYEKWFEGKPELNILRIMGLFDRSAEDGAINAVRADPSFSGLTSELKELSNEKWQYALNNLREARLLAREDSHRPDTLDCHPLIREHFAEKLKSGNSASWKGAHRRLYEYYESIAKEYPDTIEEMSPLYLAVIHGCEAGCYQEALNIYFRRIQRGDEYYNATKLGAWGAELAILSSFFEPPWKPVLSLTINHQNFVLNEVGLALQAMGRLMEAIQPSKTAVENCIALKDWRNASIGAHNLTELYLMIGDLTNAQNFAKKGIEVADRSRDGFRQISNRANLANVLFHTNPVAEAIAIYRNAEVMQKKRNPRFRILSGVHGFDYCNLLLSQGKYQEVLRRAAQTIKTEERLLDIALDNVSLGKAHLLQAQDQGNKYFTLALEHLNQGLEGLRQAGFQGYIIRGILARAELYRVSGDLDSANHNLSEAMSLVERSGMSLYQADCHLEYARLYLTIDEKGKALESLTKAKEMVEKMGYHLRDKDVKEIEGRL